MNDININQMIETIKVLADIVQRHENSINNLYNNRNVIKGWYDEFNKDKVDYEMEINKSLGVTNNKRDQQIIVSLTSFPERMYELKYTLYSLLNQSLKPDKVILWLATEQFPNGLDDIAPSIVGMTEQGLTIEFCHDIKSYKKIVYALEKYPDELIVTADDDIYYPENWLEQLYSSYLSAPEYIHCHRAHRIKMKGNMLAAYNEWEKCIDNDEPSFLNFSTTGGGVIYPPHSLFIDYNKEDIFSELAPNADDAWIWAMSVLGKTKTVILKNGMREVNAVNIGRDLGQVKGETALSIDNTGARAANDIQLNNILSKYPEILSIISENYTTEDNEWTSGKYWNNRYLMGGNSGAGSYNRLSVFKAKILNEFVKENKINKVIEWGCGDGNQLELASYKQYIGYDVAQSAIDICRKKYMSDRTKHFIWSGDVGSYRRESAELVISLDVIYHLVEDEVFEDYMYNLFDSSSKYVIIYSSNYEQVVSKHVRCRNFTKWIEDTYRNEWNLNKVIENEYPYDDNDPDDTSWSDFYIYVKRDII